MSRPAGPGSRVDQSKLSPLEDPCPSLDCTNGTSATPLGGRRVRPSEVGTLRLPCTGNLKRGPVLPLAVTVNSESSLSSESILLQVRAPEDGRDFSCMFWRLLMVTWALSLIPIRSESWLCP